jgi:hypothetical protein
MSISKQVAERSGRKGGRAKSERKALASRQNILLRWHGRTEDGVIPSSALIDGAWYRGRGRTTSIARWDATTASFFTVGINSFSDPLAYPAGGARVTRIKQEGHVETETGSFAPTEILA